MRLSNVETSVRFMCDDTIILLSRELLFKNTRVKFQIYRKMLRYKIRATNNTILIWNLSKSSRIHKRDKTEVQSELKFQLGIDRFFPVEISFHYFAAQRRNLVNERDGITKELTKFPLHLRFSQLSLPRGTSTGNNRLFGNAKSN
jgi:hypothetical protein